MVLSVRNGYAILRPPFGPAVVVSQAKGAKQRMLPGNSPSPTRTLGKRDIP
jgi:hypothetical protein